MGVYGMSMKVRVTLEFTQGDREILRGYYGDTRLKNHDQLRSWVWMVVRANLVDFADSVRMAEDDEKSRTS